MQQIDPFRMLGRFDTAIEFLMNKYHLSLNTEVQDWDVIFMSLAAHVNDYDRKFCLELAKTANENVERTNNLSFDQIQADEQRSIGAKEAAFIFKKEPYNYAHLILDDKDYRSDMEAEKKRKRREVLNSVLIGLAIIVVIFIGMSVYNLPYFAENRKYTEIERIFNSDGDNRYEMNRAVEEYVNDFPRGEHLSEVLYYKVRAVKRSENVGNLLEAIDFYMEHDPHGKYIKECKNIYNALWDKEINKFEKIAQSSSKPGTDFVVKMLKYMRANYIRRIEVKGVPHLNIKEYKDYPSEIRKILEAYPVEIEDISYAGKMPQLPDDLHSLKDMISMQEAEGWTSDIVSVLQQGFDGVLTPKFIKFYSSRTGDDEKADAKKFPKVVVDYTVSTQESIKGVPDIWTYTQTDGNITTQVSLYMGIEMAFKADFSLPGEDADFVVSGNGDPGNEEFNNVDPEYIYSRMCGSCLVKFAEKIVSEFGLNK